MKSNYEKEELAKASIVEIENRLMEVTGIQIASMGGNIADAVGRRMLEYGLDDAQDYARKAVRSCSELQELVEEVVVPETWFFRDRTAFKAMTEFAAAWWMVSSASSSILSFLSVPCSTGEEPYSIVMALTECGLPSQRFKVDALDISLRALARARCAVYGSNSFREGDIGFRDRFFNKTPDGYELAENIRSQVQFHHGNILSRDLYVGASKYDIILCRNLLIYFDTPTQRAVLKTLEGLLTDDGILFLGSAESFQATRWGFSLSNYSGAFAVQKELVRPDKAKATGKTLGVPASSKAKPASNSTPARKGAIVVPTRVRKDGGLKGDETPAPPNETPSQSAFSLERATELADAGQLAEAAEMCEAYLKVNKPSADAYYILGVVRDAQDRPTQAIGFYRKALYLEPNHRGALTHLALVARREGDSAGAERLRNRAIRQAEDVKRD